MKKTIILTALLSALAFSPAMAEKYDVIVKTSEKKYSGTDSTIFVTLRGERGRTLRRKLDIPSHDDNERGDRTRYTFITNGPSLGRIHSLYVTSDYSGDDAGWKLGYIQVKIKGSSGRYTKFPCWDWFTPRKGLEKVITTKGCD